MDTDDRLDEAVTFIRDRVDLLKHLGDQDGCYVDAVHLQALVELFDRLGLQHLHHFVVAHNKHALMFWDGTKWANGRYCGLAMTKEAADKFALDPSFIPSVPGYNDCDWKITVEDRP